MSPDAATINRLVVSLPTCVHSAVAARRSPAIDSSALPRFQKIVNYLKNTMIQI